MKHNYFFYFILFFCVLTCIVDAQVVTQTIQPNDLTKFVKFHSNSVPPMVNMPHVDIDKLRQEDESNDKLPPHYGIPIEVNLGFENGSWEFSPFGGRVWKLAIKSNGATCLNIFFDKFHLPAGAVLFAYNADKTRLFGPVTSEENNKSNNLATSLLIGDTMTIELFEPIAHIGQSEVHISHIVHGFLDYKGNPPGTKGAIGNCHHDVTCPQGNNYQNEVDAVAMIIAPKIGRWGSGTLINNACNNLKPNFLTAFHLVDQATKKPRNNEIDQSEMDEVHNFSFIFNYKASSCGGNENGLCLSLMGGDLISSWNQTDFALIQLWQQPTAESGIRYAGWDRSGTIPTGNVVSIHHPEGNVMKISVSSVSPEFVGDLKWHVLWGDGVTEPGSSGSGLFTNQNKIIGQLIGGRSSCGDLTKPDFYGSLSVSWNGNGTSSTRLRDHLSDDPSVVTTNTVGIPSFNFPDIICGQVPLNNFNWNGMTNMGLTGLTYQGVQFGIGAGWQIFVEPIPGYSGNGFLNLEFKPQGITCNEPLVIHKDFQVGLATPQVELYHNWDCSGWVYVTNVQAGTTYNWIVDYNGQHLYYQGSSVYLPHSSTGNVYYYLEASNSCTSTWVEGYRQLQGCGGWYSVAATNVNKDKKHNWNMQLSPNPVANDLNISLSDYDEGLLHTLGDVKVFNMTGQVVYQAKQVLDNTMRLNIQNLTNGIYILEIKGDDFSTRQRFNVSR